MQARRLRQALCFVVSAGVFLADSSVADTIFLKNGQRIEGHIIAERGGNYTVEAGPTIFELSSSMIERVIKYTHRDTSLVLLGDSFVRRQDYEQARRYYQRALAETEHKEVVLKRLKTVEELIFRSKDLSGADTAYRRGDFRLAADLYLAMLAGHPDDGFTQEIRRKAADAYCAVAKDYFDKARNDEAIFELRRAMQLNPLNARAHALAGHLLSRQGKYGSAYDEFALALEIDKTEPLALEGLKMSGRDIDEYLAKHARGQQQMADARPLTELFGEAGFQGQSDRIVYSALSRRESPGYGARFNLQALRTPQAPTPSRYPFHQFRSNEALSIFLQAYNAGPGAVTLYDGQVPYRETVEYVKRVKAAIDSIAVGQMEATPYDGLISKYAGLFGFSPVLIKAIVKVESNFNPKCVSRADARGLIQLVRTDWNDTMKRLGLEQDFDLQVFDPEWNLFVGCCYLRWLVDEFLPEHFAPQFG